MGDHSISPNTYVLGLSNLLEVEGILKLKGYVNYVSVLEKLHTVGSLHLLSVGNLNSMSKLNRIQNIGFDLKGVSITIVGQGSSLPNGSILPIIVTVLGDIVLTGSYNQIDFMNSLQRACNIYFSPSSNFQFDMDFDTNFFGWGSPFSINWKHVIPYF